MSDLIDLRPILRHITEVARTPDEHLTTEEYQVARADTHARASPRTNGWWPPIRRG
jgi:hypothetical protein